MGLYECLLTVGSNLLKFVGLYDNSFDRGSKFRPHSLELPNVDIHVSFIFGDTVKKVFFFPRRKNISLSWKKLLLLLLVLLLAFILFFFPRLAKGWFFSLEWWFVSTVPVDDRCYSCDAVVADVQVC